MNPQVEVRVLSDRDLNRMHDAHDLLGEAFEDQDAYCRARPSDQYLAELLTSRTFIALVAIDRQRVIGALAGYVLPKFEQQRSEFYIYDLAVAADHRREGVATARIQSLRHIAASRGIYVIVVQADRDDDPAIAQYANRGVREDVLHFDIIPDHGTG